MEDNMIASELGKHAGQLDTLRRVIEGLGQKRIEPLEASVAEIILGNVNGICERLERLEQAHANLERQVLEMLTSTLPSSTDRITHIEHQVNDYVQSEIDRLENRLNEHGERLERACRRIEVTDR